jgi:hypothetical protein
MASDLTTTTEPNDITKPDVSPVDRPTLPEPRQERKHRLRFVFIYALLAAALGAAIAGVVVYANDQVNSGPAWSAWKPSGGGLGAAKQIAEHIAPSYRLPDGKQLVDVITNGPVLSSGGQKIPVPYVVVRGKQGKVNPDQIASVSSSDTYTFSLCGLGQACSIATGKPSVQRGTLVRREILELALYTFRYVRGAKNVVAFLPPPAGSQPTYVVYLKKDDLDQQLHLPLTRTLRPKVPLASQITPGEQQKIDALTETRTYKFGLSQTQTGDAVLVLDPLA